MICLCEYLTKTFILHLTVKKPVCIKFNPKRIGCGHVYLNDKKMEWVNQIKHLRSYIDRNFNDGIDWTHKKSIIIGQINTCKLCANSGCLQMSVFVRLFKTYCCTFYGSQI